MPPVPQFQDARAGDGGDDGEWVATAAALAGRSRRAWYVPRAAAGLLFIAGGALLHVINLATGADYADFADPAHFAWVTNAWNAVVVPNHLLFIGLLAQLEATQECWQSAAGAGANSARLLYTADAAHEEEGDGNE